MTNGTHIKLNLSWLHELRPSCHDAVPAVTAGGPARYGQRASEVTLGLHDLGIDTLAERLRRVSSFLNPQSASDIRRHDLADSFGVGQTESSL